MRQVLSAAFLAWAAVAVARPNPPVAEGQGQVSAVVSNDNSGGQPITGVQPDAGEKPAAGKDNPLDVAKTKGAGSQGSPHASIPGCDPKKVQDLFANSRTYLDYAIQATETKEIFEWFFGNDSTVPERFKAMGNDTKSVVRNGLERIKQEFSASPEVKPFPLKCSPQEICDVNGLPSAALTTASVSIQLCPGMFITEAFHSYWRFPAVTLIHEYTHALFNTSDAIVGGDKAYGLKAIKMLQQRSQGQSGEQQTNQPDEHQTNQPDEQQTNQPDSQSSGETTPTTGNASSGDHADSDRVPAPAPQSYLNGETAPVSPGTNRTTTYHGDKKWVEEQERKAGLHQSQTRQIQRRQEQPVLAQPVLAQPGQAPPGQANEEGVVSGQPVAHNNLEHADSWGFYVAAAANRMTIDMLKQNLARDGGAIDKTSAAARYGQYYGNQQGDWGL